MLCEVKIWNIELKCEVCLCKKWYTQTLRTEFMKEENAYEYNQEVRYTFECTQCGNCKLFGMIASEEDIDDVNIRITPLEV